MKKKNNDNILIISLKCNTYIIIVLQNTNRSYECML